MAAARFEVVGRVQGVGFRYFVARQAQALQLRGWVRNCENAGVEVRALGTHEALAALEAQLRLGPRAAQVTQVIRTAWPLIAEEAAAIHGFTIVE